MKKLISLLSIVLLFASCAPATWSHTENDITVNGRQRIRLHIETVSVKKIQPKKIVQGS